MLEYTTVNTALPAKTRPVKFMEAAGGGQERAGAGAGQEKEHGAREGVRGGGKGEGKGKGAR